MAGVPTPQPLVKYLTSQKKETLFSQPPAFLVFTDNIQEGRLYDMPTMHGKMSASSRISRTYCSFVSRIHQVKNRFADNIRFNVPSKIQVFKNSLSAL